MMIPCGLCGYPNLLDGLFEETTVLRCRHCDVSQTISIDRLEKPKLWNGTCYSCKHEMTFTWSEMMNIPKPYYPACESCEGHAIDLEVSRE